MRAAFMRNLIGAARLDNSVCFLVGDVGYNLVEPFKQEFPKRFINVGIAEQNMIGIACGLALSGKKVFVYSLANFPTFRCLEQIRNDLCYHHADVKIVTSGGGLSYGALGISHAVTEDLAIMRALPEMTVIAPGDPLEAGMATLAIASMQGPCYLRLAKTGDPIVHKEPPNFKIGSSILVQPGNDICLISTGSILPTVVQAAKSLLKIGIQARVLSMPTIKPLDKQAVYSASDETRLILSVEEHQIIGGLGSAVAEILAEKGYSKAKFKRIGLDDKFCRLIGNQDFLKKANSLTSEDIVNNVKNYLETGG